MGKFKANPQSSKLQFSAHKNNPACAHGPSVLITEVSQNKSKDIFVCGACRSRKDCGFYLLKNELDKFTANKKERWDLEIKKFTGKINHRQMFLTLNKIQNLAPSHRGYCQTCCTLEPKEYWEKHSEHDLIKGITDYQLTHPTEFLPALVDSKKEAQYLFSKSTVETTIQILRDLKYRNVICIGTPRIFEYIQNNCDDLNAILLDFDKRFHSFFGPLNFCWYNSFNDHFFFEEAKEVFNDFLQTDRGQNFVLVTDPPYGGRTELLANTFKEIEELHRTLNKLEEKNLPMFWFFPYFMKPKILGSAPDFHMLDYKVNYDNHPLLTDNAKGRKFGSSARIFTTVDPKKIVLPVEEGYKYCKLCEKYVYKENIHCSYCNKCSSEDGRTYVHCKICNRCVKPTWEHCKKCKRCALPNHICDTELFRKRLNSTKRKRNRKNDRSKRLKGNKNGY